MVDFHDRRGERGRTAAKSEWYHGTPADLTPGDLIEPNTHPPSHNPWGEELPPREHVYLSDHLPYISEHYGPNVYEVEPTGPIARDPEYAGVRGRKMMRSKHPLRVVRKMERTAMWGGDNSYKVASMTVPPGEATENETVHYQGDDHKEAMRHAVEQMMHATRQYGPPDRG